MNADAQSRPTTSPRKARSLKWLFALLAVAACAIGVLVSRQFRDSERHIVSELSQAHEHGTKATVEQCVDHVVGWAPRCRAMRKMCEWTYARMTHACLAAQDRRPYCDGLEVSIADRRFGYKECQTRGATKGARKKACASAYLRVASHCRWLTRRSKRPKGDATTPPIRKQESPAT